MPMFPMLYICGALCGVVRLYLCHISSIVKYSIIMQPRDRYALRVHDMLVSYTEAGRKPKKVLGERHYLPS